MILSYFLIYSSKTKGFSSIILGFSSLSWGGWGGMDSIAFGVGTEMAGLSWCFGWTRGGDLETKVGCSLR